MGLLIEPTHMEDENEDEDQEKKRKMRERKCGKVGVVSRVHLLLGEVRGVTAALKVVEEVQEEVQEIEDE